MTVFRCQLPGSTLFEKAPSRCSQGLALSCHFPMFSSYPPFLPPPPNLQLPLCSLSQFQHDKINGWPVIHLPNNRLMLGRLLCQLREWQRSLTEDPCMEHSCFWGVSCSGSEQACPSRPCNPAPSDFGYHTGSNKASCHLSSLSMLFLILTHSWEVITANFSCSMDFSWFIRLAGKETMLDHLSN